jgi:hypothetical protein
LFYQQARLNPYANQRAQNHVAARPGETVEVKSFHKLVNSEW